MTIRGGIEAQLLWQLLYSGIGGVLEEPEVDYGGLLDRMEAAELLTPFFLCTLPSPAGRSFSS